MRFAGTSVCLLGDHQVLVAEFDGIVVLLSKGQQVVLVPIQTGSGRTHTLFTKMSEETREELGHNVSTVPVDVLDRLHGACPGGKGKHRALASGNGRQTTGHHLLLRVVVLGDEVTELALGACRSRLCSGSLANWPQPFRNALVKISYL